MLFSGGGKSDIWIVDGSLSMGMGAVDMLTICRIKMSPGFAPLTPVLLMIRLPFESLGSNFRTRGRSTASLWISRTYFSNFLLEPVVATFFTASQSPLFKSR